MEIHLMYNSFTSKFILDIEQKKKKKKKRKLILGK